MKLKRISWMTFVSVALLTGILLPAYAQKPLIEKPCLVSTEWLSQNLGRKDLRILDARYLITSYMQGRIPGAVYLNSETVRRSLGGVPGRLMPPERIALLLGELGITAAHSVVVYSSSEDAFAAATYTAFILEMLGNRKVGVLDGGFEKWASEGRKTTTDFQEYSPAQFVAGVNQALRATNKRVRQASTSGDAILFDARAPQQFKAGHIPNAKNLFLKDMLEGEKTATWKPADRIREKIHGMGLDLKRPVITYCNTGREGSQIWFTLRHVLGLPKVSLYDGSIVDWTVRRLPQEKSAE